VTDHLFDPGRLAAHSSPRWAQPLGGGLATTRAVTSCASPTAATSAIDRAGRDDGRRWPVVVRGLPRSSLARDRQCRCRRP
jgi:hypothetical protein